MRHIYPTAGAKSMPIKVCDGVVISVFWAVVFCFLVRIAHSLYQVVPVTLTALERCVYQLSCHLPRFSRLRLAIKAPLYGLVRRPASL